MVYVRCLINRIPNDDKVTLNENLYKAGESGIINATTSQNYKRCKTCVCMSIAHKR